MGFVELKRRQRKEGGRWEPQRKKYRMSYVTARAPEPSALEATPLLNTLERGR